MKRSDEGSAVLATMVAEIIERRRRGEEPDIEEYRRERPELASELDAQLRMIELLERCGDPPEAPPLERAGERPGLGELLAGQPASIQRLVFLRTFEKRPWSEIARLLGRPERDLRLSYARVIRLLIDYLGPGGSPG